jgi:hypothetical protein
LAFHFVLVDIAWSQGIQPELSESVALLINEPDSNQEIVNQKGYKFYTDLDEFKSYVEAHYVTT